MAVGRLRSNSGGFSVLELMLAMVITLGIGGIVFQLFISNERVFRDQNLILEMQQNARAVASMIADEIRMAGQGVPIYSAKHAATIAEATQTLLDGTDADNLRFRAGIENGVAVVTDAPPLTYTISTNTTVGVDSAQSIFDVVGSDTGRHVFLWGPTDNAWTWVRAEITDIPVGMTSLQVTPRQIGGEGGTFAEIPSVSLEEGVSYRLNSGDILRGVTTDFTSLTAPTFVESTVGENFSTLQFTYFDESGTAVNPTTLALRASIRRVDFVIQADTSDTLSNGSTRSYAVSMSISPRNVEIN